MFLSYSDKTFVKINPLNEFIPNLLKINGFILGFYSQKHCLHLDAQEQTNEIRSRASSYKTILSIQKTCIKMLDSYEQKNN